MKFWKRLESHPMAWHVDRGWSGGMRNLKPWMVLVASAALGLLVVLAFDRGVVPFFVYAFLYLIGALIFSPLQLSTVIAGERESRSLELVMAAPVTARQILTGKVLRALPVNIGLLVVSVVAMASNFILNRVFANTATAVGPPEWTFWLALCTTSVVAPIAAHAVVVWISTQTRTRTAAALGSLVGILGFHTVPLLLLGLATAFGGSGAASPDRWNLGMQLMYLSPFSHFGLEPDTKGLWMYVLISWTFWGGLTAAAWIASLRSLERMRRRGIEN